MPTVARLFLGTAAAWTLWTIAVMKEGADDGAFRIVFGLIVSVIFVMCLWAAGLALRIVPLGRLWVQLRYCAFLLAVVSAVILVFGSQFGLTRPFTDPETGEVIQIMDSRLLIGAYVLVVFPIVNWPRRVDQKNDLH